MRFSDTIHQINDKKYENAEYFNFTERYKFDFSGHEVDIDNQKITEILQTNGLLDSYDFKNKGISLALLKDDFDSMLSDFFQSGTMVSIDELGNIQKDQ